MSSPKLFWTRKKIEDEIIKPGLCFTGGVTDSPELELEFDIPVLVVHPPKARDGNPDTLDILIGATRADNARWHWDEEGQQYIFNHYSGCAEIFFLQIINDPHRPLITYRLIFSAADTQSVWEGDFYKEPLEDLYVSIVESNLKGHRSSLDHILKALYDKNMKGV